MAGEVLATAGRIAAAGKRRCIAANEEIKIGGFRRDTLRPLTCAEDILDEVCKAVVAPAFHPSASPKCAGDHSSP